MLFRLVSDFIPSTVNNNFRTDGPKIGPNCLLSNIMERDLLPNVDFVHDPNTWLFSWDNSKPECADAAYKPLHENGNALIPSGDRGIGNYTVLLTKTA